MPTPPDDQALIASIASYATGVTRALQEVAQALLDHRYGDACSIMNDLTQQQAKTSLTMRSILIKGGHIGGGEDD